MDQSKRIALLSGPRNVSTALMYSFAQREDTAVLDEPLFGYFLKQTGVWRPSRTEVLSLMETDPEKVINTQLNSVIKPVHFDKHMANHFIDLDPQVLLNWECVFLIRDPREVLASYIRQVEKPTSLDLCYGIQVELYQFLKGQGRGPVIVDSKDILKDPKGMLKALCRAVNIDFEETMLNWKPGALKEDGVWAKYWYHNVHRSTGFVPYRPKNVTIPENLIPLLHEVSEDYTYLEKRKLKTE